MIKPAVPQNEEQRLEKLISYGLFDGVEQKEFNDLVNLASFICDVPISLITLIDKNTQYHKAKVGIDVDSVPREVSFCAHSITNPDEPLIVEDARLDERFKNNPLVKTDPNIVFYAGVPLVTPDGYTLGSICVIDRKPRNLSKDQMEALSTLSNQVIRLFELRKTVNDLDQKEQALVKTVEDLDNYTAMLAHDLKTSFRNIELAVEVLKKCHGDQIPGPCLTQLNHIQNESVDAMQFINHSLDYAKSVNSFQGQKTLVDITLLFEKISTKLKIPAHFNITLSENLPTIFTFKYALQHIFENIIQNSVKYMDKAKPEIAIEYQNQGVLHVFSFYDNGPGIPEENQESIFKLYSRAGVGESDRIPGSGVGLAVVSKLVNLLQGHVELESIKDKGTTFRLYLPRDQG